MGGSGSGRHAELSSKRTIESFHAIDIRAWGRNGLLAPGSVFMSHWSVNGNIVSTPRVFVQHTGVRLEYRYIRQCGESQNMDYSVQFAYTPCHFGGSRVWFLCPNCQRRVALLYGVKYFLCRHCLDLAYESQRESHYERAARKADNIRKRLGWRPGIINPLGFKPKGMHWATYSKAVQEIEELQPVILEGLNPSRKYPDKRIKQRFKQ